MLMEVTTNTESNENEPPQSSMVVATDDNNSNNNDQRNDQQQADTYNMASKWIQSASLSPSYTMLDRRKAISISSPTHLQTNSSTASVSSASTFAITTATTTTTKSPLGLDHKWNRVTVHHSDYRDYLCGFGAAIVNICVTFPINKIIFRQMLHGHSVRSAAADLRAEGIRFLYRGVGPPLIQRSITLSLMFGTFGTYNFMLDTYAQSTLPAPYVRFALAAFLAGTTEALLCPFERIQMLLQDDRKHHLYHNTVDAFKKIHVYGLSEYYRGISAILLRNGPSNILFFTFRDEVKRYLPRDPHLHPDHPDHHSMTISILERALYSEVMRDFITGSCIGALISTIFYPINVIRTQMQTQPVGSRHLNLLQAYRAVHRQRDGKLRMLFRGVHINYSRSFLSWGIINACYELFHRLLGAHDDDDSYNSGSGSTSTRKCADSQSLKHVVQ